jgi:hypothetical protein
MCLNYIKESAVSDGTVACWKVFEYDFKRAVFRSPFYHCRLQPECYADKNRRLYEAQRDIYVLEDVIIESAEMCKLLNGKTINSEFSQNEIDLFFDSSVKISDSCEGGFVHAYHTKEIGEKELCNYYAQAHVNPALLVKCIIPEGKMYHVGAFDSDYNVESIATKCLMLDSVESVAMCVPDFYHFNGKNICRQAGYKEERTLGKDMETLNRLFAGMHISGYGSFLFTGESNTITVQYNIIERLRYE